MILEVKETQIGWEFSAKDGEEVVSWMEAVAYGEDVAIHNEVYNWNKENALIFMEMFNDIRAFLKAKGVRLLIPVTDKDFVKTKRYWKLYGFDFFGEIDGGVYAVMEA